MDQSQYSSVTQIFSTYMDSKGHDATRFLKEMDWSIKDTANKGECVRNIWKGVLEYTCDSDLGLNAGKASTGGGAANALFVLAANSPTVGDALENLCKYHELYCHAPHPRIEENNGEVSLVLDPIFWCDENEILRHISECFFSTVLSALRSLTKTNIVPEKVNFSCFSPQNTTRQREFFQTRLQYLSGTDSLVFSKSDIRKKILFSDPTLLAVLESHAASKLKALRGGVSWQERVANVIREAVSSNQSDIKSVARRLCISVRCLQQKLKDEGTSFQVISNEVKVEMAMGYLKDGSMSISQIALEMGYSDQSAFSHAFKRLVGRSPKQVRSDITNDVSNRGLAFV